jgi:glycerophosphoryl diester phosphodiesterase family protein
LPSASYTPQLRPLSIGEVLDAGFRLLRARFGTLLVCVLVPIVPLSIVATILEASTNDAAFDVNATTTTSSDGSVIAGSLLGGLLQGVAVALAVAACFRVISSAYLGEEAEAGPSLRYGLSRLLPLIVAYIVMSIVLGISFFLLFIPFVFLAVKWSVTFAAIVSERAGPFAGLGRSWELTRGHWWRTFGTLLVLALISFVLYFLVIAGLGGLIAANEDMSKVTYAVLSTALTIVLLAILYPLIASIITVIYYDLRVRNEGFDLQLLAQGVGADAARFESAPERPGPTGSTPPPAPSPGTGGFAPPEGPAPTS